MPPVRHSTPSARSDEQTHVRDIARLAIERPLYTWLFIVACLAGGIWGIDTIGRLEDPPFPVKMAYIITPYPGASAETVEHEVTDRVEAALQELPYVEHMTSKSVPGRSEIEIELYQHYEAAQVPQIWDEMRRRVSEAAQQFPPGAGTPWVEDDFGDVYGIYYAVTVDGYQPAAIADVGRRLSAALSLVDGVAKVATSGEPQEAIYVAIAGERLDRLGLPLEALFASIGAENRVIDAGSERFGERRLRIAPETAFDSVEAVRDMRIGVPGSNEILRLGDIATVSREALDDQPQIIRHNGVPAITIGVSANTERNVVELGRRVDARMAELAAGLPLGMEVIPIYAQHVAVQRSIDEFLWNLGASVLTVFAALFVFMGWRAGVVVGSVLFLTVFGTIALMALIGIELQRISLGALMIAMGMLVDNAIVVAEGMVVGVSLGQRPADAASHAVRRTRFPLLGATLIGILAFAPIGLSRDNSGFFLVSLFQVVGLSLLLSWVLAITVVPLLGSYLLVDRGGDQATNTPSSEDAIYSGWSYAPYRTLLKASLRLPWLTTLLIVGITLMSLWTAQFIKPGFFPTTNTPLFFVDVHLPQGTDINATSALVQGLETQMLTEPEVAAVSSFVGRSASRFVTVFRPEQPNPAYAQMIVRVADVATIPVVIERLQRRFEILALPAEIQFFRIEFSPGGSSKIEARLAGPDADTLRELGERINTIYLTHNLIDRKLTWRQRSLDLVPVFDAVQARRAGITRQDVSMSLAYATSGVPVGLFRDKDKLVPIIARAPAPERGALSRLEERLVWSPTQHQHVPMSQVVSRFELKAVDDLIWRRDRERTLTVQANPPRGHNPTYVFNALRAEVEAVPLPPGYHLDWGGEFEASAEANQLLFAKLPVTFGAMLLITLLMFGHLRQALVIWLTVPMIVCGVVLSLLATDLTLTFPAFLGFLSLTGMLIKNCIVLVDEIDKRLAEAVWSLGTVLRASVSRLRPVMLAAGTTIAGMAPLLTDAFFREMAVTIMGGLAFATLLTLIAVPVFYRIALGRRLTNDFGSRGTTAATASN
ncbi:MAG: efflux RND transporter permease subunit [Pseudomonadales bacterium]|nr:efflux RND transporter permease subunit [Pseudomonadales bacterium]